MHKPAICAITLFQRVRRQAGIRREDGASYPPRIHDIRHTSATHRLVAWYQAGADVQKLLPQLATYLGHSDISSTQVYLSMTPELLREASIRYLSIHPEKALRSGTVQEGRNTAMQQKTVKAAVAELDVILMVFEKGA